MDEHQKDGVTKNCISREPMTVAALADCLGRPANAIIMLLLKQGVMAARNQVLSADQVAALAAALEVEVVEPKAKSGDNQTLSFDVKDGAVEVERLPVVVVVGHVDHGKTTLLDHIRKTRVAARERGGITQHIGAYRADTPYGGIVFIDTPGHEAFSVVRARGISAADIVILVVAADNGVQSQTIEALERAKRSGAPIIVAINKIDRASIKQIEDVRGDLSRRGLVPEEWGGDTIFVPISALKGDGVDHLLEMVVLRAQMSGLKAFTDIPAICYVLESRLEKGRGPVATVICRNGTLRVGDSFFCGDQQGRVSSLYDAHGKSVQYIGPSEPAQVAGFSDLPRAGDVLKVVHETEVRAEMRRVRALGDEQKSQTLVQSMREDAIKIVLKTDTVSSKEVLVAALEKLSGRTYAGIAIVSAGIGPIFESDVEFAADTGAYVYSLHVKADQKTARLAQDLGVKIHAFDIIYKLLEHIEELAQRGRPVKKVLKKIGEALVLKIFDIKKLGIVAGARVVDGVCSKTSSVKIFRANRLVGKGTILSLQRDKNAAKEVRKGFECAFMVDGFTDWQVDDRIECYDEVKETE